MYGLPKGHIEHAETELEATYREIYEEAGVESHMLHLLGKVGTIHKPEKNHRQVHLYMFHYRAPTPSASSSSSFSSSLSSPPSSTEHHSGGCGRLEPVAKDEVAEARWVPLQRILNGEVKLKPEMMDFMHRHLPYCHSLYQKNYDSSRNHQYHQ